MLPAITTASVAASDADSDPLAYAWSQAAAPGIASFTNAAASSTAVAFSAAGSYKLRVAVSDGHDTVNGRYRTMKEKGAQEPTGTLHDS